MAITPFIIGPASGCGGPAGGGQDPGAPIGSPNFCETVPISLGDPGLTTIMLGTKVKRFQFIIDGINAGDFDFDPFSAMEPDLLNALTNHGISVPMESPDMPGVIDQQIVIVQEVIVQSGDILDANGHLVPGASYDPDKNAFVDGNGMVIPNQDGLRIYIGPDMPGTVTSRTDIPLVFGDPPVQPPPPPPMSPPTAFIAVVPPAVQVGDPAVVAWTSTDAMDVRVIFPNISYVAPNGREDFDTNVEPGTYSFNIIATNELGQAADITTLNVLPGPASLPEATLSVSVNEAQVSDLVRITWTVSNASQILLEVDGGLLSTSSSGSFLITSSTARVRRVLLTASNEAGTIMREELVNFDPANRSVIGSVRMPDVYVAPASRTVLGSISMPTIGPATRTVLGSISMPALKQRTVLGSISMPAFTRTGSRVVIGEIDMPAFNPDATRVSLGEINMPPFNAVANRHIIGQIRMPAVLPPAEPDNLLPPREADAPIFDSGIYVFAYMFDTLVNMTADLVSAQWRWGSRFKNQIGNVAEPASGTLVLDNKSGKYNPVSSAPGIDPTPGVEVWIYSRLPNGQAHLLFSGWSTGIVSSKTVGVRETVVLPLEGALARISARNSELFARIDDNLYTGQVLNQFLNNVGWRGSRTGIDTGNVQLNWRQINSAVGVGGNRQFQNTLNAFNIVAQAETSVIYDDYTRSIVFKNSDYRQNARIKYTLRQSGGSGTLTFDRADYLNPSESIINFIEPDSSEAKITSIDDWDVFLSFNPNLPEAARTINVLEFSESTLNIPFNPNNVVDAISIAGIGNMRYGIEYLVRDVNGNPLVLGQDFIVEFTNLGQSISVFIRNLTSGEIAVIINRLPVRLLQNPLALGRLALETIRNDASIRKYGRKHVAYPAARLFIDRSTVNVRLRSILERHKGVEGVDPLHRINIHGIASVSPELLQIRVGDAVALDEVYGTSMDKYIVDEVAHSVTVGKRHNITLSLTAV